MPGFLAHLEMSPFVYISSTHTHTTIRHIHSHKNLKFIFLCSLFISYICTNTLTYLNKYIYRDLVVSDIIVIICFTILFPVSLSVCDKMSNTKILYLFADDKNIAAMQQSDSPDSLSPRHQENQSKRQRKYQQEDQEQEEEQENLQDGSSGKRKWECDDEASGAEIHETPIKSKSLCYHPPRPPRKPKAIPAMKRRAMWVKRSVVFLDVAREVELMFPPSVLQDFGNKIKKARS